MAWDDPKKWSEARKAAESRVFRLNAELSKLDKQYDWAIARAEEEARKAAQKAHAHLKEAAERLNSERCDAVDALNALKVAEAGTSKEGPKIGTILVQWKRGYGYNASLHVTKTRGRVEVWTPESEHPPNVRWSLPSVGDKYIRILKADGTPSRTFDKLSGFRATWLPEGKKPGEKD